MAVEDDARREPSIARLNRRQRMDLCAVALVGVGGLGLTVTAYVWSPLAACALICVCLIAIGVVVGFG